MPPIIQPTYEEIVNACQDLTPYVDVSAKFLYNEIRQQRNRSTGNFYESWHEQFIE